MRIVGDRLLPGRHEAVAGNGLRELAGCEALEPERIVALVRSPRRQGVREPLVAERGRFGLQHAGTAPGRVAGWGCCPAGDVAGRRSGRRRFTRRTPAEAAAEKRTAERPARAPGAQTRPVRPGGGHVMVPQANFTFLDAIGQGLLLRPQPDVGAFVHTLLRHTPAEDPAVWSHTLLSYGRCSGRRLTRRRTPCSAPSWRVRRMRSTTRCWSARSGSCGGGCQRTF